MRIKANPQGHKRGVGEIRTRSYTYATWRHRDERIGLAGDVPAVMLPWRPARRR
jgi:hypothetical protein